MNVLLQGLVKIDCSCIAFLLLVFHATFADRLRTEFVADWFIHRSVPRPAGSKKVQVDLEDQHAQHGEEFPSAAMSAATSLSSCRTALAAVSWLPVCATRRRPLQELLRGVRVALLNGAQDAGDLSTSALQLGRAWGEAGSAGLMSADFEEVLREEEGTRDEEPSHCNRRAPQGKVGVANCQRRSRQEQAK
jgi:hypothetical protein